MYKKITLAALLLVMLPFAANAAEILFSGRVDSQFDLFKADLKTGKVTRLTDTPSDETMPALSPDRRSVAFISDRQGADSLYLADINAIDKAEYISAGMGCYANPRFSPDGNKILVKYAPDPEAPLAATRLVLLDPQNKRQQTIVDSLNLNTPDNSETTLIVDWPLWISENLIVYVLAEVSDEISGRLTRSTLYLFDMKNNKHVRMGGGESYFTDTGRSMGFKATMPTLIEEAAGFKYVAFTAIKGNIDREPMQLSLTGSGKGIIALEDANYFGPLLFADNTWIYGTMNDDSRTGIAFKNGNLSEKPQNLKFDGDIIFPTILNP